METEAELIPPHQNTELLAQATAGRIVPPSLLPPILEGCYTLSVAEKTERFVFSIPEMLERWISRCASPHTQRAYRQDLFTFIGFAENRLI